MFNLIIGIKIKLPIIIKKFSCNNINNFNIIESIIAKIKFELGPAIEMSAASSGVF